jgi:thioredoxin family protein
MSLKTQNTWRPSSHAITSIERLSELRSTGEFFVHVWADWNGYDRAFDRELHRLIAKEAVRVFSIDCDDQQFWDFLRSCNVTNVPELLVFRNGIHLRTIQSYDAQFALGEAMIALKTGASS